MAKEQAKGMLMDRSQALNELLSLRPKDLVIRRDANQVSIRCPRYNSPFGWSRSESSRVTMQLLLIIALTFLGVSMFLYTPYTLLPSWVAISLIIIPALGLHWGLKTVTFELTVSPERLQIEPSYYCFDEAQDFDLSEFRQFYVEQSYDYISDLQVTLDRERLLKNAGKRSLECVRFDLRGCLPEGGDVFIMPFAKASHAQFVERLVETLADLEHEQVPGEISRITDCTRSLLSEDKVCAA